MAFTDSYTALLDQAMDRVSQIVPEHRAVLHAAKLRNVQNAIIIAAGQNPVGALLDMTVMVTLQRQVAEDYWLGQRFGEAARPLVEALERLEDEIWLIADRALDAEEAEALRALIPEIRERFSEQVFVSSIRASDFAENRGATVANLEGGGSLLTLFQLDPLAGLTPAAQELAQTRLLAERAFFWAKRLPLIVNWHVTDVILETLAEPETRQILDAATRLTESTQRFTATAEDLSRRLPEERTAAMEQLNELLTAEREAAMEQLAALTAAEREAAIEQAFEGIATEREAILRTFEQEDVRLRGLLEDVRASVEAGTTLSASLTTTIESAERLLASFAGPPGEPRPEGRPFDITDYAATAEAATATVEELNGLMAAMTELMSSPAWDERSAQLTAATDRAQTGLEQLIDRSYRRGHALIGVLIVGSLLAALLYRVISARLIRP